MLDNRTDRRIKHTKKYLKEALLELMMTKTIDKISTTELCKVADINRNTFYAHYSTPEDLLNEIENEILDQLEFVLKENAGDNVTYSLFEYFKKNKNILRILSNNKSSHLYEKTSLLCKEHNIHNWKSVRITNEIDSEMYYLFTSSGAMKLVFNWLNNDCDLPIEELCGFIDKLSLYGLNGFLNKEK